MPDRPECWLAKPVSDPSLGQLAEAGIYRLARITAGATATFQVLSAKGYVLPDLAAGTAYEGGYLNLTVVDGATDFVVGGYVHRRCFRPRQGRGPRSGGRRRKRRSNWHRRL